MEQAGREGRLDVGIRRGAEGLLWARPWSLPGTFQELPSLRRKVLTPSSHKSGWAEEHRDRVHRPPASSSTPSGG